MATHYLFVVGMCSPRRSAEQKAPSPGQNIIAHLATDKKRPDKKKLFLCKDNR